MRCRTAARGMMPIASMSGKLTVVAGGTGELPTLRDDHYRDSADPFDLLF